MTFVKHENLLNVWHRCGGYYLCPRDDAGNRIGPLVGYAGTYHAGDGVDKQFVGDGFYNFAQVDQYHHILDEFAQRLADKIFAEKGVIEWALGAPEGGKPLAQALARQLDCQYLAAEKRVFALKTNTRREMSTPVMGRHSIPPGSCGVIVEDVCYNFSTTKQMIDLVHNHDAEVLAIACALNRSDRVTYHDREEVEYSIIPVLHVPMPEYMQDHPAVAADIERDNVVRKPKDEWDRLMRLMELGRVRTTDADPTGANF